MYEPFTPLTPPGTPQQPPRDPSTADRPPVWTPAMPVAPAEPVGPSHASAVPAASPARRSVGPRFVLGAVLASALLASGGTYVAISATHTATPASSVTGTAQTPAANNASTGNVAAGQTSVVDIVKAVSPAVVTIVADGVGATDPITGQTGVGIGDRFGRHLRFERPHPDQPPCRRRRSPEADGQPQGRTLVRRHDLRRRHAHRPRHRQGRRDRAPDGPDRATRPPSRWASRRSPSAARSGPSPTR